MNEPIVLRDALPTLEEYIYLCSSVGWTDYMNFDVAEQSLRQSLFSVSVRVDQQFIGMGRIVGDGAIYFYIQDIIVHPDFQGRGIGREIMDALMDFLANHAPEQAFIRLFASNGKGTFYEKYGFNDYSPNMTGMFKVMGE